MVLFELFGDAGTARRFYPRAGLGEGRWPDTIRNVELVDAIRRRTDDPKRRTDSDIGPVSLLPVADSKELDAAEAAIGHPLPHVLRLLLEHVANGGFGPGYGLLGVGPTGHRINLASDEVDLNLPDFHRFQLEQDPEWDRDQLAILDWGDAMLATVSLSTGMVSNYSYWDKFISTGEDLYQWLMRWARGERVG